MSRRLSRGRSTPAIRAIGPSPSPYRFAARARSTLFALPLRCSRAFYPLRATASLLERVLPLPLLVTRVRADHEDPTAATDHAAPVAHLLHAGPDLHARSRYLYRYTTRPRVRSYGDSSTLTRSPGRIRM